MPENDEWIDNYVRFLSLWNDAGRTWSPSLNEAFKRGEGVSSPKDSKLDAPGPIAAEACVGYLDWSLGHYGRKSSYYSDRSAVKALLETPGMARMPVASIDAHMISTVRSRLEQMARRDEAGALTGESLLTASTINLYLDRIRLMIRWCKSEGFIEGDPEDALHTKAGRAAANGGPVVRAGTKRRPPDRRSRVLVTQRLRASQHKPLAAMTVLQSRSTMRPNEVCMMKPELVVPSGDEGVWVYFPPAEADKIKRDNEPTVPILLGPRCWRVLRPWMEAAIAESRPYIFDPRPYSRLTHRSLPHYTPDRYARLLREACEAANRTIKAEASVAGVEPPEPIERFTPYQLRHDGATRLDRHGDVDLDDIRKQMRHTKASTTLGYIDPSIESRIEFAAKYC